LFGFNNAFMQILAEHPPAPAEAERASTYHYLGMAGTVASSFFGIRAVYAAMDDTRAGSSLNLPLALGGVA
jgi:hypothetical protein